MSFAFGHLFGAYLLGKGLELRNNIDQWGWIFLLLGSLLPDADFILDWTLGTSLHRTFSHSLLFLIVAPLLLYFVFKNLKWSYLLGSGIITHFLLDMLMFPGVPLFWPNTIQISYEFIGYIDYPGLLDGDLVATISRLKLAVLDMAIGTFWLFYLLINKKTRL